MSKWLNSISTPLPRHQGYQNADCSKMYGNLPGRVDFAWWWSFIGKGLQSTGLPYLVFVFQFIRGTWFDSFAFFPFKLSCDIPGWWNERWSAAWNNQGHHSYSISEPVYVSKKSRIQETKNLSTDAGSRTDKILENLCDISF